MAGQIFYANMPLQTTIETFLKLTNKLLRYMKWIAVTDLTKLLQV